MIPSLAKSRIKFNKSRTILTIIAIMLTTTLLMGLGTSTIALLDMNKQQATAASNIHATLKDLTAEQVRVLKNHVDVEALETNEIFATINYGKMNGFLTYTKDLKSGIYHGLGTLTEGRFAENKNEISGPPAFFKRLNVEPVVGNTVTISFRPNGEGKIITRDFTICGLVTQVDTSQVDVSDSRIAYGAGISEELIQELLPQSERRYNASIRVTGENSLNYDEIKEKIKGIAVNIGCNQEDINYNGSYLFAVTESSKETAGIVFAIALLIVVFSGLVIYSIYYVSVITDVQEIGKLKALGASKKQVKRLLLTEGLFVSCIAIPMGLALGFLIPYFVFPMVIKMGIETTPMAFAVETIHMFSLPVLLTVTAVALLTVYISLLKPMRMAAKISPIDAIRYQESSRGKAVRSGNVNINVFRLSSANLTRNKRRTAVTMITMGLSCVLFMSLAGTLNSMSPEDIAGRQIEKGDFKLALSYSSNDKDYPENNLDSLQQQNIFSDKFMNQLQAIDGVEAVERHQESIISSDYPVEFFADGRRVTMGTVSREQAEDMQKEVKQGVIDYDQMVAENGVIFTSNIFWEEYGLQLNQPIDITLYDGNREIPLTVKITASLDDGSSYFLLPQEVYDNLGLKFDPTSQLYIYADKAKYESAKAALESLAETNERFRLYSMDEEMEIAAMSVNIIKYPMYMILLMIAVIGFMNLINTMITSIITRKRELGVLQAIGLSNRQLTKMLAGEGVFFTAGTLLASVTLGNLFGYLIFLWAKSNHFMSISAYHYPLWETIGLAVMLVVGQLAITHFIGKRVQKESLIDRIRSGE